MDIEINDSTAFIFDLDDTLYNEFDFLRSAYKEISIKLDKNNWPRLYTILLSQYRSNKNVFEYLSKEYNVSLQELIFTYRNHTPNISTFEDVIPFFDKILSKKGTIGIITDGRTKTQMNKINVLGIKKYLSSIIISESLGYEKPNKTNYLQTEINLKLSNYFYIGDNYKKDFITAKKMGWNTVARIDNGKNIHPNSFKYMSAEYMPHYIIETFDDFRIK